MRIYKTNIRKVDDMNYFLINYWATFRDFFCELIIIISSQTTILETHDTRGGRD